MKLHGHTHTAYHAKAIAEIYALVHASTHVHAPDRRLIEVRHARVPAGPAPGPARAVMQYSHAHFLATHARPGSIWGAFERQKTVRTRRPRERTTFSDLAVRPIRYRVTTY